MTGRQVGAVLVVSGAADGILTERDVLRASARVTSAGPLPSG